MSKIQDTFMELLSHMRVLPQAIQGMMIDTEAHSRTFLTGLYRSPDGEAGCPVGFLIPDSEYLPELEGMVCLSDPIFKILVKGGHNPALCTIVQRIHDLVPKAEWESAMKAVADTFGLSYSPPLGQETFDAKPEVIQLLGNSLSSRMFAYLHDQAFLENKLDKLEVEMREHKKKNPVVAALFANA